MDSSLITVPAKRIRQPSKQENVVFGWGVIAWFILLSVLFGAWEAGVSDTTLMGLSVTLIACTMLGLFKVAELHQKETLTLSSEGLISPSSGLHAWNNSRWRLHYIGQGGVPATAMNALYIRLCCKTTGRQQEWHIPAYQRSAILKLQISLPPGSIVEAEAPPAGS